MSIRLEDIEVSFRGPDGGVVPVLNVPKLELADGVSLALMGGSGSGKTTLLHVLAGIIRPSRGRVFHDNVDLAGLRERQRDRFRAKTIGYVFQSFNLLQGLTALENLQIALGFAGVRGGAARERARSLLERVGLSHRLHAKPRTLSAGEQQRVAIARAVVNHPKVVLADEPTANLDEKNGDEVLSLIQETARASDAILVLVTHEERVAKRFTDVRRLSEISR